MARRPRGTKARRPKDFEIDQQIGQRLKERRLLMGLSQTALADGLGITFQQLQKYEKGHNRIACGRLYACAQLLKVQPEYFFEGLEGSENGTEDDTRSDEALKLARAYYSIGEPTQRQFVRMLIQAISASGG